MSRFTVAAVCSVVLFSVTTSGPPAQAQAQGQFAYCKADAARERSYCRLCERVEKPEGTHGEVITAARAQISIRFDV
jgi:hypothetical protein